MEIIKAQERSLGKTEQEIALLGTPSCNWQWKVVKKAFDQKFGNQNYVLMHLRNFTPTDLIKPTTISQLQARLEKFPGTFYIFNGFKNTVTFARHEEGHNILLNHYHSILVDLKNKKMYEPWSPSGYEDDAAYDEGELDVFYGKQKDQMNAYLDGPHASNRIFGFITSIYIVNICMDGNAKQQINWRYQSEKTASSSTSNTVRKDSSSSSSTSNSGKRRAVSSSNESDILSSSNSFGRSKRIRIPKKF